MTTPQFPTDAAVVARMLGHPGLDLLASGVRGPVFDCAGDCATLWWPDPHLERSRYRGRDVLVMYADRYASANGGNFCDDCKAIPAVVALDPDTLTFIGDFEAENTAAR